jgi:hypothetical protein
MQVESTGKGNGMSGDQAVLATIVFGWMAVIVLMITGAA